jgi:hypothetical protein
MRVLLNLLAADHLPFPSAVVNPRRQVRDARQRKQLPKLRCQSDTALFSTP